MKPSRFAKTVDEMLSNCKKVLTEKGEEYSRNGDRLWNFKVAAAKRNITPEQALDGMYAKHDVSVLDMINSPDKVTRAMLNEKIGDSLNYLLLLNGLFIERIEASQVNQTGLSKHTNKLMKPAWARAKEGIHGIPAPTPIDDDYHESQE